MIQRGLIDKDFYNPVYHDLWSQGSSNWEIIILSCQLCVGEYGVRNPNWISENPLLNGKGLKAFYFLTFHETRVVAPENGHTR